jgi:hypothetical protein
MIKAPHADDAFAFIADKLKANPDGYGSGNNATYDVWLPTLVWAYLPNVVEYRPDQGEYSQDSKLEEIWRAFYDAAWRLCRLSVLRPTVTWARYAGAGAPGPGNGYSYTSHGRAWLKNADLLFVPSEAGRYLELLARESGLLGPGFSQRAGEAAACHQTSNYLACCAMCGAAAESAILQIAITKVHDEEKVLKEYLSPNGRRKIFELIFGPSPSKLEDKFISSAANLLFYWRDETAHGQVSNVSEIEAFHSLTTLVRFAQFLSDNWGALMQK